MITIYEYLECTQGWVLEKLRHLGLLTAVSVAARPEITFAEVVELMRHDHYRRVRGALRQMGSGVVVR